MSAGDAARLRVLIVEDEWLLADLLEATVRDLGFDVAGPVASVKAALEIIATEVVSLGLLDVTLGNEKSFPVARRLAERGAPFLFITGHLRTDLPAEFKDITLIAKPIVFESIGSQINNLIFKFEPKTQFDRLENN